jgi:putative tricarboxylic transport membrane protein
MLCALLAAYRVRAALILPIAVLVSLIVHTGFYKLLKVPLPWGVLQSVAW